MKKPKPLKIVEVHWVDSMSPFKVWNHKDDESAYRCAHPFTIGMLVRQTAKVVTLAQSFDPIVDNYGAIINIPVCAITKIRTIR